MALPTIDSVSTLSSGGGATVTSLTWAHTCGSGNNRYLIVFIYLGALVTNLSVTYNNIPLSLITTCFASVSPRTINMFCLVNPPTGTYNIVASWTTSVRALASAASYSSVDQITPIGTPVIYEGASPAHVDIALGEKDICVDVCAGYKSGTAGLAPTINITGTNHIEKSNVYFAIADGAGSRMKTGEMTGINSTVIPGWTADVAVGQIGFALHGAPESLGNFFAFF